MRWNSILLLAFLALPIEARGQDALALECAEGEGPVLRIESCSRLIQRADLGADAQAWVLNNRGLAYAEMGRDDRAMRDYTAAIAADPGFAPAYNNRGNLHALAGDLDRAIADHSKAVELDPDYVEAYYNRAVDFEETGALDRALEDYDTAARIDPEYSLAFVSRASVHCRLGNPAAAMEDFTSALARGFIEPKQFQERLKTLGHYRGTVDGVFGPGSRKALQAWVNTGCSSGS